SPPLSLFCASINASRSESMVAVVVMLSQSCTARATAYLATMRRLLPLALLAAACTSKPAPVTTPTPVSAPSPTPTVAAPSGLPEAPANWQLMDEAIDHVPGISVQKARRELLAGKAPKQTVTVAVIDGGVDTLHKDLKAVLLPGWDYQ